MTSYEKLSLLTQALIFAAAVVYSIFAWGQWRSIKRQADIARNQDRPWIMVIPDNPEGWPSDKVRSSAFQFLWTAHNAGKSPAFLTKLWVAVIVAPYPVPDKRPDYREPDGFAEFIIPPNGKHTSKAGKTLTESDVASIKEGKTCIMFYGFIHYRDTFNITHRTRFCSYWYQRGELREFSPVGPRSYIEYT